jgi:hypothetical protein
MVSKLADRFRSPDVGYEQTIFEALIYFVFRETALASPGHFG